MMKRRGRPPRWDNDRMAMSKWMKSAARSRRTVTDAGYLQEALMLATKAERAAMEKADEGFPLPQTVLVEIGRALMAGLPRREAREIWKLVKSERPRAHDAARAIRGYRLGQLTAEELVSEIIDSPRMKGGRR